MKIAVVCADDLSVVLFCSGIVKALQDSDRNSIYVISDVWREDTDAVYRKVIKSWGVTHIPLESYRFVAPMKDVRYMLSLYQIFRREQIDMVMNICTKPNIYGSIAAKCANAKRIVSAVFGRGLAFSDNNEGRSKVLKYLVQSLYWMAFRLNTKVWFTNEMDCTYFSSRGIIKSDKIISTRFWLNTDEYCPSSVSAQKLRQLRRELGIGEQNKVVIMVARMSWAKGIREFVDASVIVRNKLPMVKFILVGPKDEGSSDGVPEAYLRENEGRGNIIWLGFRKDVKELYAMADLAVLPSYYKEGGFPRALTEPMAMGKPIIASNSIHCRGPVDEGKNGYLVPIRDSRALAEAIEMLIRDDRKRRDFGRYSRLKAEKEFNENEIVSRVIEQII